MTDADNTKQILSGSQLMMDAAKEISAGDISVAIPQLLMAYVSLSIALGSSREETCQACGQLYDAAKRVAKRIMQ